ncbi:MAG: hypothetical protein LBT05_09360 [Planctomycetaceae bacterium]|jgi:beta-galactosidase/beta-glucuronidase|nr:hypothetical protein [Planctomycetaceae bacterium]
MRWSKISAPIVLGIFIFCFFGKNEGIAQGSPDFASSDSRILTKWGRNLNPDDVLQNYPRPQMMRSDWLNLNGYWELETITASSYSNNSPQKRQENVFSILVPFSIESPLSGVGIHATTISYKKRFRIPSAWSKTHRILLHFGAADWEAVVQVNGKYIGTHRGGYDSFSFDITDAILWDAEQTLVVKIIDPTEQGSQPRGNQSREKKRGRHTSVTGIWQTVWLEPTPETSIRRVQMTPDFDAKAVKLQVFGENLTESDVIQAELYDGKEFLTRSFGGADGAMMLRIPELRFKAWSPESPHLYNISIAVLKNNKIIDQVSSYVGVRKIETVQTAAGRMAIYLNGKPYFQKGVSDHGVWPDGLYTAPSEAAMQSDLMAAKAFGFNMIRKTAKVEPERWYYLCDAMGLLVWQEIPAGNNNHASATAQFDFETSAIIRQLENHPSVVCWILFQQGIGEHNSHYYLEKAGQLDSTRLICVSSGAAEQTLGKIQDWFMLSEMSDDSLQQTTMLPTMAQTIGRYGGVDLFAANNSWSTEHWGYREVFSTEQLLAEFCRMTDLLAEYRKRYEISAATFHQLVDLETETDGLVAYNRELMKVPYEEIHKQLQKLSALK